MQEFRRRQLRIIFPTTYRYNNAISVALDALAACLSSPALAFTIGTTAGLSNEALN